MLRWGKSQVSNRAEEELIVVEVAYAKPEEQLIIPVKVPPGTTVRQAIEQSGILERFPDIDLSTQKVGIFGRVVPMDRELNERDRVEIYRPLIADPKAMRRERAKKTAAKSSD